MSASPPPLVAFYSPTNPSPDHHGRTLTQILSATDHTLEYQHNYIQTLFPLPEPSPINPNAPTIDHPTFLAFRSSDALRSQLKLSLTRMLAFYGFSFTSDSNSTITIVKGDNFSERAKNWVTRFNHNHLRITRIIRSLRVLGCEEEAEVFFGAVRRVHEEGKGNRGGIGERSMMFWERAAKRPLYLAPEYDDDGEGRRGVRWLWEFEVGRGNENGADRVVKGEGNGDEVIY